MMTIEINGEARGSRELANTLRDIAILIEDGHCSGITCNGTTWLLTEKMRSKK